MTAQDRPKLGLIQSRGLGDIIIALPIAHHYHREGYQVHWPICEPWIEQMRAVAPYVTWHPVQADWGAYFLDTPMKILQAEGCEEIIPLYQALTGQTFHTHPCFQHTGFDQYKYIRAGVPFLDKWRLPECITRHRDREEALYDRIIGADSTPYVVTHLQSSEHQVDLDPQLIPQGWRTVSITSEGWVFDWLKIIEGAECIVMTDSCMANLVDQLGLGTDRYFIPLHHIGLTPVQGQHWTWLSNPKLGPQSQSIRVA